MPLQSKKIILYELNEVPFRVLDHYGRGHPGGTIATLLDHSRQFVSVTEDEGHLSPWITWASLHRGVPNTQHMLCDLSQDLTWVDAEFPPIWKILADSGIRVGLGGSLHSYPPPADLSRYAFYMPDTFSSGDKAHPGYLSSFAAFNLAMVDKSGRNVSRHVHAAAAARMIANSPRLGLGPASYTRAARQILSELRNPIRVVRRRTTQSQIAFDIFHHHLRKTRPAFATFFTNHVASSMHRYWPATFPEDYAEGQFSESWKGRFKDEIPFTLSETERQLNALVEFVDSHDGYALVVASSMGQEARANKRPLVSQLLVVDDDAFMDACHVEPGEWQPRRAMQPIRCFQVSQEQAPRLRETLSTVRINGAPLSFTEREPGFFRVQPKLLNVRDEETEIRIGNRVLKPREAGLTNMPIQDEAASNAYHIPEGTVLTYDPADGRVGDARRKISALSLAPSILKNYGLVPPAYMRRPEAL